MRAAVFERAGRPLTIARVTDPKATGNDLVIAVKRCGICGSDLHMADVQAPSGGMAPLPAGAIMGHEFCGEVVEIGPGAAAQWKTGDRVTALPYFGCGTCQACLSGMGHRCAHAHYAGLGASAGAYAEFMRVGGPEALRLPAGVDWQLGALVEPLAVGLHGVHAARLAPGESVLVMGGGPIGQAAALWSRHLGARDVVVSDMVAERLAIAGRVGATATIDAGSEDVIGAFKRIAGRRPDVVLECIGIPGSQQLAMNYAPAGGRIVIIGVCMAPDTIEPVKAVTKELQVNYVFMYRRQDFGIAIEMMDRERIDPSAMLSSTVGFDEFPSTFEALKTDKSACKVLLDPAC